jgi:hypothetical protein
MLAAMGAVTVEKSVSIHVIPQGLTNWALNQPAAASSVESGHPPECAVDGNAQTRWSTDYSDPQWVLIDLGKSIPVERVLLQWETAFGKEYELEISEDQRHWFPLFTETNGDGGIDDLMHLSGTGKYIRLTGTSRATQWGYSLWEFGVYSSAVKTRVGAGGEFCPGAFALEGNYPNPFNASTTISFYLPRTSRVTLSVFNLKGQMVEQLIRQKEQEGKQRVCWTPAVPSGLYFCRMEAVSEEKTFHSTKKITLLR